MSPNLILNCNKKEVGTKKKQVRYSYSFIDYYYNKEYTYLYWQTNKHKNENLYTKIIYWRMTNRRLLVRFLSKKVRGEIQIRRESISLPLLSVTFTKISQYASERILVNNI